MQKTYYDLSVNNPGAVAWYCALKLEMLVHLTKALLTEQLRSADVPGLEAAKARLKDELERKLGVEVEVDEIPDLRDYGLVDDFYVSFEWSDGGMIHAHMAFWIVGAPRIDKVEVPKEEIEEIDGKQVVEIEALPEGATVLPQSEAADSMATFWDRCITEFNVAKALAGVEGEFCQRCSTSTENVPQTLSGDDVLGALGPRGDATVEDGSWARMCEHRAETGIRIKLGKAREREFRSPEAISYRTYAHCLLEGLDLSGAEEEQCWDELLEIMRGCSRIEEAKLKEEILGPISASAAQKRARARKHFVAALAEWVNMHDSHKPFALGPPGKEQSCACVDDEHSKFERTSCNKLFPRKLIEAGSEEVAEDPRRRDLYRLWLARNCHFMNNFVPVAIMALLSNMDFQATLSKDAVIEYMTKYMTKSGQGSLIKVMEHSFSLCIEKARENLQGTGSAVLRWFNLQSITEVKSQLETMHLISGAPRYMCSREFKHLFLRAEVRQAKSKDKISEENDQSSQIVEKSQAEHYVSRHDWELPSDAMLNKLHPLSGQPLWKLVLLRVGAPVSDSAGLLEHRDVVKSKWLEYLERLS